VVVLPSVGSAACQSQGWGFFRVGIWHFFASNIFLVSLYHLTSNNRKKRTTMSELKTLPAEFAGRGSQRGYFFTLIERKGNVCLYQKTNPEYDITFYEVAIIQKQKERNSIMNGVPVFFEAKEAYPSDEQFGTHAWCYNSLPPAQKRFQNTGLPVDALPA